MKVVIAKTAGFCMGVKRAVDLALEHAAQAENGIQTLGPLIHNRQTLDMLKQRGVEQLKEGEQPDENARLLIRAHGIPPETQKHYTGGGHEIIDGTCPKVKTVHKVIERYRAQGYRIIITGDEGHPEVIGLMGYAGDAGILIDNVEAVATLPMDDKICLVSQTTFDRILFDLIAEKIRERYAEKTVIIKKTICSATDQRQKEVASLAKQVDALIVVGGKNSANTQRLAKIASESGTPTQQVESEQEIEWDKIAQCQTVGITAGASTPNWMIKRVTDYLHFMNQTKKRSVPNLIRHLLDILANLNLFVATGALCAYYASCYLQGFPFTVGGGTVAFLYFLTTYLWNSMASIESMQHHGLSRYRFYRSYRKQLMFFSGAVAVVVIVLSFFMKKELGYLMVFASIAGSAYHITLVPPRWRTVFRYKNLKDIPSSRDLFVALAWGTVLTFMPHVLFGYAPGIPIITATFCWIFILAFLRSLIFDLRDIEGDRIMGRETLITIVGEKRARKALQTLIVTCFVGLLLFPAFMGVSTYRSQRTIQFLFQIPVLLYIFGFVKINPLIKQNRNALFNLLADGLFYLAAAGAFLASLFLT